MSKLDSFGLAKQTALGTKQTVMEQFPQVESVDVKDVGEKIATDETTGSRATSPGEKGTKGWEITAKGSARPQSLPKILAPIGGAPTKTQPDVVNAPTAYSYLFALKAPDPVYHSALVTLKDPKPTSIVALFWDILGSSFTLEATPNGFLEFTAGYFALDIDRTQAVPTPTLDASKKFPFDKVKVYATVNAGAEAEIKVSGWSLAYDAGLDTDMAILGTRKLDGLDFGDIAATVSFTPKESLPEWFDRAIADDPDSVKIRMTATGPTIGGAVAYKVEVIAYLAQVDEAPAGIDAKSRLNAIPVKATCYLDDVSGKFVTVEVVNTTNNAA